MAAMAVTTTPFELDPSRLPAFDLVVADYEAERAGLLARVVVRLAAKGHVVDPADETDPIVILSEEVAYGRFLGLQQINDAGKRNTITRGYGAALDHLAATYYADVAAARLPGEDDERFRRRLYLAAQAKSVGTLAGYEYWALTFGPKLIDARARNHASGLVAPGEIALIVVGDPSDDGPEGEAAQLAGVIEGLLEPAVKLASDHLIIRAATRTNVALQAVLGIPPGPDGAVVIAEARKRLDAYLLTRRSVGAPVTVSALHAVLMVSGVERVRLVAPAEDIAPPADGVVQVTSIDISAETLNV